MEKKILSNVTLLGIDCLDIDRLIEVAEICQKKITFGDVKLLTSLKSSSRYVVKIPHLSYVEISKFLIKELHRFIDTKFVLIIQHDGFILNPNAWSDSFLEYDYIGAPWWYHDQQNVGNGGFSLRSKRLCEVLANEKRIIEYHAEDFKICRHYRKLLDEQQIRFAPEYLANRFSCEGNQKRGTVWRGEFGFHHYDKTNLKNWRMLRNAHLWKDRSFIKRFLLRKRQRYRIPIAAEIIENYVGQYSSTGCKLTITIEKYRGALRASIGGTDIVFHVFDESFFFSDSPEKILEFRKYRSYQLLILYENNGRRMKAIYLRKHN